MLPESADQQRKPREQRRLQAQENRKAAANQHNPTMHPATRAGKIRRFLTPLPGRRVNAPPLRKCSHILRARQSARKPRRQAVRQRTERRLALAAIPTGNSHSRRTLAPIRAMTRQPATDRPEPKAPRRACLKPTLPANVIPGSQTGLVTTALAAHGPAIALARANPSTGTRKSPARQSPAQGNPPRCNPTRKSSGLEKKRTLCTALFRSTTNPRAKYTNASRPCKRAPERFRKVDR